MVEAAMIQFIRKYFFSYIFDKEIINEVGIFYILFTKVFLRCLNSYYFSLLLLIYKFYKIFKYKLYLYTIYMSVILIL